MFRVFKQCLFLMVVVYSILPVFCLALDNDKPVYIIADSFVYNHKTGVHVFDGHVKVDQGDAHLIADRLVTKRDGKQKIQEAIAYGVSRLAHYWTTPQVDVMPLHAKAKVIRFYPNRSLVILERDVLVTQAGNSFKGTIIIYNIKNQVITVPHSQRGHATIVYDPETQSLSS